MDDLKIARINELYKKSKNEELSPLEQEEQKQLRQEFIEAFRKNLRGQLDNIAIKNEDGTITPLKEKAKKHE